MELTPTSRRKPNTGPYNSNTSRYGNGDGAPPPPTTASETQQRGQPPLEQRRRRRQQHQLQQQEQQNHHSLQRKVMINPSRGSGGRTRSKKGTTTTTTPAMTSSTTTRWWCWSTSSSWIQMIKPQTIHAAGILILAIVTSMWYNHHTEHSDQRHVILSHLLRSICQWNAATARASNNNPSTILLKYPCHKAMGVSRQQQQQRHPSSATLATIKGNIPIGAHVISIPRHVTIWDIDALRDPWIQQQLLVVAVSAARTTTRVASDNNNNHDDKLQQPGSSIPTSGAAYLAVYLARQTTMLSNVRSQRNRSRIEHDNESNLHENPTVQKYLSFLPKSTKDYAYHPVVWSEEEIPSRLGTYTSTYDHVMSIRRLIQWEYDAFTSISTVFTNEISFSQYTIARLNVLTRSFGSGPLMIQKDESVVQSGVTVNEVEYYQSNFGIDISKGCHVMVPILDQYNHHAQPHVGFEYRHDVQAFVVTAVRTIPAGSDIYDSYGKRTDSDLFAKYGFVNGDGSDYTQASIALWHHLDPEIPQQTQSSSASTTVLVDREDHSLLWKRQILRYLLYDDGYELCVQRPDYNGSSTNNDFDSLAWMLKRYKYQHLLRIGRVPDRWVVRMPPRDPTSLPLDRRRRKATEEPISQSPPVFDSNHPVQFDASGLYATCRLIVLTHLDYNGQALGMLQDNLHNDSFILPTRPDNNEALEFRTLMCIARMAQTAIGRFGVTIPQQIRIVSELDQIHYQDYISRENKVDGTDIAFVDAAVRHTKNWTVAHLRLGEMQTLEVLKQSAFAGLRTKFASRMDASGSMPHKPEYSMRDSPCPHQLLQPLYEEVRVPMSS